MTVLTLYRSALHATLIAAVEDARKFQLRAQQEAFGDQGLSGPGPGPATLDTSPADSVSNEPKARSNNSPTAGGPKRKRMTARSDVLVFQNADGYFFSTMTKENRVGCAYAGSLDKLGNFRVTEGYRKQWEIE